MRWNISIGVRLGTLAFVAGSTAVVFGQQQSGAASMPGIKWNEDQIRQAVAPTRAGRRLAPKAWPNGARVAVCLSFDLDYEAGDIARNIGVPVALSAREYGAVLGLPRILTLLDQHAIPASFYVSAVDAMLHPESVRDIVTRNRHEIGVKGWMQENLVALNDEPVELRLLNQAIEYLTQLTGRRPVGYRAPGGAFSKFTLNQITKANFLYDSSMMAMDDPYEIVSNGRSTGVVELPVAPVLDDEPYFTRGGSLPSPELIFRVYRDEFDMAYKEGGMLMLVMRPHIIGHRSRFVHLENLVKDLKSTKGVWFATAEQIAAYVKGQRDAH
jgi:peptidoglycan/xylan/chitin deacetylase (PgdA/CDA1 family)